MAKEKVIKVDYSKSPIIRMRVIDEDDSALTKASKSKYPFEVLNQVTFNVVTDKNAFSFNIPRGFVYNGADIPKFVWSIVGSPTDNSFLIPSLAHDYLLEFKPYVAHQLLHYKLNKDQYRDLTTDIFKQLLIEQGVSKFKAGIMASAVSIFQKTVCNKSWEEV